MLLPRRRFLATTSGLAASGALAALTSSALLAQSTPAPAPTPPAPPATPPPRPPLLADNVRDAVGKSHRDLAAVRALVEADPLLVNACWDWGGGDFETPLQAAAHTGQRAIAEYLLSRGARLDVFAAAMLGQLEFIRAVIALDPKALEIHGPHGFTLLHCAKRGGPEAQPVYDFLRSLAPGGEEVLRRPLPYSTPPPAAVT